MSLWTVEVFEMQELIKYKGLTLIQKYGQYYIRFWGGQHEETLCDLLITEEEANSIFSNPEEIKNIRDTYKRKVPWTKEYFVNSAKKDELIYRSKSMDWRYIKPLSSEERIDEFENLVNYNFPSSFKNIVKQYNGARPKCCLFNTVWKTGRELKSFLSFNRDDKETIWEMYKVSVLETNGKYIPFAIDHFGNMICFARDGQIIFLNHETLKTESIASSFDEFMNSLCVNNTNYYLDRDSGNIVRYIHCVGLECLEKGNCAWKSLGANSNYYRELFLGEGNNCLVQISPEDARIYSIEQNELIAEDSQLYQKIAADEIDK